MDNSYAFLNDIRLIILPKPWLRTQDFLKDKNHVNKIYSRS